MTKVLITGGAGFVGRRFCKYFLDKKYEVTVVDNLQKYTGAIDPKLGWPMYNPFDYNNFYFINQDCNKWFSELIATMV